MLPLNGKFKRFQHKNGGEYVVFPFFVLNSNNDQDRDSQVAYLSLATGEVNHRSFSEFTELVEWPDGESRPRFVEIGWPGK